MTIHPARKYESFEKLHWDLSYAAQEGVIHARQGTGELSSLVIYTYSEETVYNREWSACALMCRGLILDIEAREVVATPFPKFFNVQEASGEGKMNWLTIPNLKFECFTKMDGSLIIIYYWRGKWRCATKGSLASDQAKWAEEWIKGCDLSGLVIGDTYLAEAIYPENKIVVDYKDRSELCLLGGYRADGTELHYQDLHEIGAKTGWSVVEYHSYFSISELLEIAGKLDCNNEGFVLRFSDGTRLKIKGDEYCRLHKMISHLTPLSVWELMRDGDRNSVEQYRRELPEEFWEDFDMMVKLMNDKLCAIMDNVCAAAQNWIGKTDKEVGLALNTFPEDVRRFIFVWRNTNGNLLDNPKARRGLYETIRPNFNRLEGYRASSVVTRVVDGGE